MADRRAAQGHKKKEPARNSTIIAGVLAAASVFGLTYTVQEQSAITAAVNSIIPLVAPIVAGFYTRQKVTPVEDAGNAEEQDKLQNTVEELEDDLVLIRKLA